MAHAQQTSASQRAPAQSMTVSAPAVVQRKSTLEGHSRPSARETAGASSQPRTGRDLSRIPAHSTHPTTPAVDRPQRSAQGLPAGLTIQRKCSCGGEGGECEECRKKRLQSKSIASETHDPLEREADQVADRVLAGQSSGQAHASPVAVQRVASGPTAASREVPSSVNQVLSHAGTPLHGAVRHDMEQRFGHDFSHVRVHTGSEAAESARDISAHAYTAGRHIVFARDQYSPAEPAGRRLLAHELTHVLQQSGATGSSPRIQRSAKVTNRATSAALLNAIARPRGRGEPLSSSLRADLEGHFDHNFSNVRIHAGTHAQAAARALGARAFTVGSDISFASGEFRPDSRLGRGVLGHELAHVVQQAGRRPVPAALELAPRSSPAEHEAELARHAVEQGRPVPRLHRNSGGSVQRLPGSAAGGCGVCYPNLMDVGNIAHGMIEAAMVAQYAFLVPRFEILNLIPNLGTKGIPDFMQFTDPDTVAIGEIKPNSPSGIADGISELASYEQQLRALGMKVTRMVLPPPLAPLPFPTGAMPSPTCPPTHQLYVDAPVNGLYTYWCMPDFRDLRPRCKCDKKPPGPPIYVPVEKDVKVKNEKDVKVKDKDDVKVPGTPPLVPIGVLAALALAIAARKQIAAALGKSVVGRAFVYVEAASVLALILLYPERVEAGVSGELAIEKLLRAMREKGIKVPKELEDRIKADPELMAILEKAQESGKYDEAQTEMHKKILQLVNDHPDEFTEEDLKVLLSATQAAAGPASAKEPTLEGLKKAIEQARAGKASTGAKEGEKGGGGGKGKPEGESSGPAATTGTGSAPKTQYPGLSPDVQKALDNAPAPVRLAWQQLVGKSEGGPKVTDVMVRRFLATMPADLTEEEARKLAALAAPASGKTLDEILLNLGRAVAAVRAKTEAKPGEGDKPPGKGDAPSADTIAERNPQLSADARAKLDKASPAARQFLDALGSKGLSGAPLTDASVDRFLKIFGEAVTTEQIDELVARLKDAKPEHTIDQVLDSIEKGVKTKAKPQGSGDAGKGSGGGAKKGDGAPGKGKGAGDAQGRETKVAGPPDSELLASMLVLLQGKVSAGEARLEWDGNRPVTGATKTGCRFFGKTADGIPYIARVSVKFTSVKELQATYRITAAGKLYNLRGEQITPGTPLVGLVRTISMDPPTTKPSP